MRVFFVFLFLVISQLTYANRLPTLGTETSGITFQQESVLGQTWLRSFRKNINEIKDPLVFDYLHQQLNNLKLSTSLKNEKITFLTIDTTDLNAFAVPGQVVGINAGLFLKTTTEQEFLSVLAHELAHLELRHFNQRVDNQQQLQTVQLFSIITAIIASQYSFNLGEAFLATGLATTQSESLAYSRHLETEADRRAITIMTSAGYPVDSVSNMLQQLLNNSLNSGSNAPEYFRTHPLSESRLADSLNIVSGTVALNKMHQTNSLEYELIKLKLGQQLNFPSRGEETSIAKKVAIELTGINELANSESPHPLQLLEAMQNIPAKFHQEAPYVSLKAWLLHISNKNSAAIMLLESFLEGHPYNLQLNLTYAKICEQNNNSDVALQVLRKLASYYETNPWLWLLVHDAGSRADNKWAAFDARVQSKWFAGEESAALVLLEKAAYSNQWSAIEKSRIRDKMQRYQAEITLVENTF